MKQHAKQDNCIIAIITGAVFFLVLALFQTSVNAAGLLKPVQGNDSQVFLKSHHVSVVINNGFARTEVDQVFGNSGDNDLEAIYSFPLPHQASLSEVSLWIDGQEIVGEVLEKQKAKEVYEDQKSKGNDTALAEKDDHKTFDISVYPVRAQQDTRIRLVYYQPLEIDLQIGRYVYPLQEGGVDEERISFWSVDDTISGSFSFDLTLKSAYPVKEVRFPGFMQEADIEELQVEESAGGSVFKGCLDFPEGGKLDKDIVFYYRLDDATPARVELVPFKEQAAKEGTFLLAITPGVSLQKITEGVDWTFVLDKSGSMSGHKIQTLVDGVSRVIRKMSPTDRFRIIAFNNKAYDVTGGYVQATPVNINTVASHINNLAANGGTAMYAGLQMALAQLDSERTQSVVLVTDGVANVGPAEHADFVKLLEQHDVRLFTFVIANSANTPLLERLAKVSGGFAMAVSTQDDIFGRIIQAKNKVLYEALHDVTVSFSGGEVSSLTPATPSSLYRGQQLVMFGKYSKPGPVQLSLQAKISGRQHEWNSEIILPDADIENPEIERLWALSAVEDQMSKIRLTGETTSLRKKIVGLGTAYSLVTDYTSMVVVNDREAENLGMQRDNRQRVDRERAAQTKRKPLSPASKDTSNGKSNNMFNNAPAPSFGTEP